ncbi:hypothetical protein [Streptomyces atratus]|uniref:hypothetical protein n=1 Tax=Streptomyces atratus TaxID=1893 RepID=UPI0013001F79|nr:hypothetical protein [Streptomyces atratus]
MTGHREDGQGAANGLLSVQPQLLGQRLHRHRRTVGQVVDEPGDIPLTLGKQREVIDAAGELVRRGTLAATGPDHRILGRGCGRAQGRAS